MLRQFQNLETRKTLAHAKLLAQIAIGVSGGDKDFFNEINSTWNEYLNLESGILGEVRNREEDMKQEYEKYRYMRPKLVMGENGKITVTGLD